jgi:hypothetical protein
MVTAKLNRWYVSQNKQVLLGTIESDSRNRWEDGTFIRTSHVEGLKKMELKEGDKVVTRNSTYLLGKPA